MLKWPLHLFKIWNFYFRSDSSRLALCKMILIRQQNILVLVQLQLELLVLVSNFSLNSFLFKRYLYYLLTKSYNCTKWIAAFIIYFALSEYFFWLFAGAGIGSVFGNLVIGYARNPSLKQQLFSYAILGFALSEAMGLFCLMMAFLILFAF